MGRVLRQAAGAIALSAVLLALTGPAAQATGVVKWPWGLTRIIRAPFDLPFSSVTGLSVSPDASSVYIATPARVLQYSETGVWVRTWQTDFTGVVGVATDGAGDVYVADSGTGQVQKFDENGAHLGTWSVPGVRGIAASPNGRVFLLVSVGLGEVVDVRSDAGTDEGAFSAVLPGSWFDTLYYSPATTASIAAIASDSKGDVYLVGTSRQRLLGSGPDCHSVFEDGPQYEFTYDDPLDSSEVAEFDATGNVIAYGFDQSSARACYPGWHSSYPIHSLAAIPPNAGSVFVTEDDDFAEKFALKGPEDGERDYDLYGPCYSCEGVFEDPPHFSGPGVFDCHEDLYSNSWEHEVVELVASPQLTCPPRPSRFSQLLSISPALTLAPVAKKGKGKGKAGKLKVLDFEAGCAGAGCTISASARVRLPHCARRPCTVLIAGGLMHLAGDRSDALALRLRPSAYALLARDPHPEVLLSARLVRHGRVYGQTFKPAGGAPLLALSSPTLTISCPTAAARGETVTVAGALGMQGVHIVGLSANQGTPTLLHTTTAGGFRLAIPAPATGDVQFTASFAGGGVEAPASASCVTTLPAVPTTAPPPSPPPPAEERPPVKTDLALLCRANLRLPFTGTLSPALAEVPVTITYIYSHLGQPGLEKSDVVRTAADGSFSDSEGPPGDSAGEARASWSGQAGYAGASSQPCTFTQ